MSETCMVFMVNPRSPFTAMCDAHSCGQARFFLLHLHRIPNRSRCRRQIVVPKMISYISKTPLKAINKKTITVRFRQWYNPAALINVLASGTTGKVSAHSLVQRYMIQMITYSYISCLLDFRNWSDCWIPVHKGAFTFATLAAVPKCR